MNVSYSIAAMERIPEDLRRRLIQAKFYTVDTLPNVRDVSQWEGVKTDCSFCNAELNQVINAVFPAPQAPSVAQVPVPPPPLAYLPQPVEPFPPIISFQMILVHVNGSLTTLSSCNGFRKYVKARATEIGITGLIQRCHHHDVRIKFEGTENQIRQFLQFLGACKAQGMIEDFDDVSSFSNIVRLYRSFEIFTDFSRTDQRGGKIIRGEHSGCEHDKLSV